MAQRTKLWSVIWQVVKFIFTIGISHIDKRKDRLDNDETRARND